MAFRTWQIGLDIQNGQLCALGIQLRRNGWQLRHWWHHALPHDTLSNGMLQSSSELIARLQRWRRQLPRHISLRVGFPPQAVLQRTLPSPPSSLREPELGRYISAAASQLFPLAAEELALDYRAGQDAAVLCLTAARRSVLKQWIAILAVAGVAPEIVEPTPGALAALGQAMRLPEEAALVHQLSDHWLWYAPANHAAPCGWCPAGQAADLASLRPLLPDGVRIMFSADGEQPTPPDVEPLRPFSPLHLMQPPLPARSGRFTLATGLALRPEDI